MAQNSDTFLPSMGLIRFDTCVKDGKVIMNGICATGLKGSRERFDTGKVKIVTASKPEGLEVSFGSRYGFPIPGGKSLHRFSLKIDMDEALGWDMQNKLILDYDNRGRNRISYSLADKRTGERNRNSEIYMHNGMSMYFRQNINNSVFFTVRETQQYDSPEGQERLRKAKAEAKKLEDRDIILMYEKNCARYEESASVLYEKLIDSGYDNVYYIVDKGIPAVQELDDKYRKNLIQKDSDDHLRYFFACKKYISSETIDHALQIRIASKDVLDKINGDGLSYVFLQHGVMYMVSLDADLRTGFRKKKGYKLHKTVVSSEAEAMHFIELGGMEREDLYITGLAKFDKCFRNEGADRIVIMPTWRRWEANQLEEDPESTGYYRMLADMFDSVPDELKDRVIILPHPLIADKLAGREDAHGFAKRITRADSYDKVLRDCSLLITDYSSIAYDAYYRGANVAFWWRDLEECMTHYGEKAHLMLNEGNVFGPVCMDKKELRNAIEELYGKEQRGKDTERYAHLVEFNDGKNSERIIEHLREDGMIS